MALNVLIIEDDKNISRLIGTTLSGEGFLCDFAYDGLEGESKYVSKKWDLVLLDLMLPGLSGYELLEYISSMQTPVIVISAMVEVSDRIRGLKMGADDYLCKPFQVGELIARVEAVIRRTALPETSFSYRDVTVNYASRTVTKGGEEVQLTAKEFELLKVLIANKNVAMSRKQLYEQVWEEEYFGDTRTLDNHIKKLRHKLGFDDVIVTVFRIGYRLEITEA